jgi:hypothetical protein
MKRSGGSLGQPGQIALETLSQKTHHKNRAGGVAQDEGPELKPRPLPPPKKKREREDMHFCSQKVKSINKKQTVTSLRER